MPSANVVRHRYDTPSRSRHQRNDHHRLAVDVAHRHGPDVAATVDQLERGHIADRLGVVGRRRPPAERGDDGDDHRRRSGEPAKSRSRSPSWRADAQPTEHLLIEAERGLHGGNCGQQIAHGRRQFVVLTATRRTLQDVRSHLRALLRVDLPEDQRDHIDMPTLTVVRLETHVSLLIHRDPPSSSLADPPPGSSARDAADASRSGSESSPSRGECRPAC